jgi:hypothetical protein
MKKRIVSMPPPKRQLIELETTSHSTPRRSFARIPSLREIPLENNSIVPLEIENIGIPMVMTRRPTMRAYKKKVCLFLLLLRTVADFIA